MLTQLSETRHRRNPRLMHDTMETQEVNKAGMIIITNN